MDSLFAKQTSSGIDMVAFRRTLQAERNLLKAARLLKRMFNEYETELRHENLTTQQADITPETIVQNFMEFVRGAGNNWVN